MNLVEFITTTVLPVWGVLFSILFAFIFRDDFKRPIVVGILLSLIWIAIANPYASMYLLYIWAVIYTLVHLLIGTIFMKPFMTYGLLFTATLIGTAFAWLTIKSQWISVQKPSWGVALLLIILPLGTSILLTPVASMDLGGSMGMEPMSSFYLNVLISTLPWQAAVCFYLYQLKNRNTSASVSIPTPLETTSI